jgi:ABC-type sugar transport system ATPase subunit
VLVFDEPTSSLNIAERDKVVALVQELSASGVAILYISHALDELFKLGHRIVVMRDGRLVGDYLATELSRSRLEELMVGRELAVGYPELAEHGSAVALSVQGLGDGERMSDISFEIREGEIFGLAGLMGSGRTEVARTVFGLSRRVGTVTVRGKGLANDPRAAIEAGVAFVTEDRRDEGIYIQRPIRETLTSVILPLRLPRFLGVRGRRFYLQSGIASVPGCGQLDRPATKAVPGSLPGVLVGKVLRGDSVLPSRVCASSCATTTWIPRRSSSSMTAGAGRRSVTMAES